MLHTVLIVLLLLALIGALPFHQYSAGYGYGPSGLLAIILVVVLLFWFSGRV